jgi:hypothetical protein
MKRSPLRGALKRNIKKADVKQTSIVWIAANSLSKEYETMRLVAGKQSMDKHLDGTVKHVGDVSCLEK